MTPNNAKELATNMLLAAYGKDEADKTLITTAVENIYIIGKAQGFNEALERCRLEWLPAGVSDEQ